MIGIVPLKHIIDTHLHLKFNNVRELPPIENKEL